jgi:hypothetical protein
MPEQFEISCDHASKCQCINVFQDLYTLHREIERIMQNARDTNGGPAANNYWKLPETIHVIERNSADLFIFPA